MPRGNPDNLRAAAQRKRAAATARAEAALQAMVAAGEPINFRALARRAGVSVDFLYGSSLRKRVEELRSHQRSTALDEDDPTPPAANVARALAAQVRELKRRHREEVQTLRAALAAAHGENLELRRRLSHRPPDTQGDRGCSIP